MAADLIEIFTKPRQQQQYIVSTHLYIPAFIAGIVALTLGSLFLLVSVIVAQSWWLFVLRGAVLWGVIRMWGSLFEVSFKRVKPAENTFYPGDTSVGGRYVFVDCPPDDEYAASAGPSGWTWMQRS